MIIKAKLIKNAFRFFFFFFFFFLGGGGSVRLTIIFIIDFAAYWAVILKLRAYKH